jgi:hypothetical protein
MCKIVNSFLDYHSHINFGDFILFQEYKNNNNEIIVSKPILAIYLGSFLVDQTLGFNYVRWVNDRRGKINEKGVYIFNEVEKIDTHIEWFNYIDIFLNSFVEQDLPYQCPNCRNELSVNDIIGFGDYPVGGYRSSMKPNHKIGCGFECNVCFTKSCFHSDQYVYSMYLDNLKYK